MRYRGICEYDGTEYGGWQRQKNAPTVQEESEKALTELLGSPIAIHGAGRTDAGVHALSLIHISLIENTKNDRIELTLINLKSIRNNQLYFFPNRKL